MTTDTSREAVERLADAWEAACREDDAATLRALLAERDGLGALVDRMHAQDVAAIQQWRAAHPGTDLQWPGQIRLTAWCLGEVAKVLAERDRWRDQHDAAQSNYEANRARAERAEAERDAAVKMLMQEDETRGGPDVDIRLSAALVERDAARDETQAVLIASQRNFASIVEACKQRAAERDAARAECQTWLAHIRALDVQLTEAQEQRDAARAEAARLRMESDIQHATGKVVGMEIGWNLSQANDHASFDDGRRTLRSEIRAARAALAAQEGGA